MDDKRMVTVAKTVYEDLVEARELLEHLKDAGLEQWEGYAQAVESLHDSECCG